MRCRQIRQGIEEFQRKIDKQPEREVDTNIDRETRIDRQSKQTKGQPRSQARRPSNKQEAKI